MTPPAERPCNICGVDWPNHEYACAYAGNVRDLHAALAEIERLQEENARWRQELGLPT